MIQCKAFQFRLIPEASQRQQMAQIAGRNRFTWNRALSLPQDALGRDEKVERYNTLAKRLPIWKKMGWMRFIKSRHIEGIAKNITVSKRADSAENRKTQASFVCLSCGHTDHADLNAAKNILTVGQMGMACGSNPSRGRKQELLGKRSSRQRAEQVPAG
jgi:transposase